MAVMEGLQGNYNNALEYFLECLAIAYKEGFEEDRYRLYGNVSAIYSALNNDEKALELITLSTQRLLP
ncbi:MAG: tetratricopeptide repeat protein [Cyclobacteriaceae bacterium]